MRAEQRLPEVTILNSNSGLRVLTAAAVLLLLGAGVVWGGDDYPALLQRAKAMDRNLDFTELRVAYAASANYAPYEPVEYVSIAKAVRKALNAKAFDEAAKKCEAAIDAYYFDPKMHVLCSYANEQVGNIEEADLYRFAADGLFASLRKSGDGRSTETAYAVVTISEEYALLWIDGLQMTKQSLLSDNGHSFDRIEVVDKESGSTSVLYFRTDRLVGWMNRQVSD